jgi:hypothetical protein
MRIVIAIFFLALTPLASEACSCDDELPLDRAFAQSSAVFEAVVTDIQHDGKELKLRISSIWKSDGGDLTEIKNGTDPYSCSFPVAKGKSYIIFAHRLASPPALLQRPKGRLWTSMCSRTIPSEVSKDQTDDKEFLQKSIDEVRSFLNHIKQ